MSNIRGVGTIAIIHGNGNADFQVVVNGIVSEEWKRFREKDIAEMQRKQKELDDAMEWIKFMTQQRNRQREHKLEQRRVPVKENNMREKIGFVLACFLCWGEALHIIQYIGNEEERK